MFFARQVLPSVPRLSRQRYAAKKTLRLVRWVGDSMDNFWQESAGKSHSALQRWCVQHPLLCELLSEVRSFLGHIEIVCTQELWRLGVAFGPSVELSPEGVLAECNQTRRRIHGSRKLLQQYPWVSATDVLLFLNGFESAETKLHDNFYTEVEVADFPSFFLSPEVLESLRQSPSLLPPSPEHPQRLMNPAEVVMREV